MYEQLTLLLQHAIVGAAYRHSYLDSHWIVVFLSHNVPGPYGIEPIGISKYNVGKEPVAHCGDALSRDARFK